MDRPRFVALFKAFVRGAIEHKADKWGKQLATLCEQASVELRAAFGGEPYRSPFGPVPSANNGAPRNPYQGNGKGYVRAGQSLRPQPTLPALPPNPPEIEERNRINNTYALIPNDEDATRHIASLAIKSLEDADAERREIDELTGLTTCLPAIRVKGT